ncbi:hypothetical protein F856_gp58 [Enterobacteria phage vB_EcoS_Rogue1]|uniref:Uncharacterized protein n=2 Tax=Rogunavirus TaxID=1920866 RepID=K7PL77_9CAUD|nr:hypothetical protein F856_gp58 [Enterobacteria phage vB_EcoS_Rogue1]AFM76610.1 hypothetical protein Rogue1_0058 [Enterobacteria phage vB_EcoS_Rogue1]WCI99832.1 hypothetical protein UDF157lw_00056 [Escherichia phage vB_EcoS-UDF157lw]
MITEMILVASLSSPLVSQQYCELGKEIYHEGVELRTVVDWLNHSTMNIDDKKIVLECYIVESNKV